MFRRVVVLAVTTAALTAAPGARAADAPVALADPTATPITGLPAAEGDGPGTPVTADGGVAVVVTNGDRKRMELYGGLAGQPVKRLARCGVKTFEEFEVREPVVSGGTVVWQACPDDRGTYPSATKALVVFDAAGTRTIPVTTDYPVYALAGRTLAIVEDAKALRLIDLDSGAERTVAVPGKGRVVRPAGQRDGTVAVNRTGGDSETSDDCGSATVIVIRPGATTATVVPGIDCTTGIALGGDRLAFLRDTPKGFPDLYVSALDGSGRQRVDGNMIDDGTPSFATDGTALSWVHNGCNGSRVVHHPLDALPASLKETCPVRIRGARLTSKARVAVTVSCSAGCRSATVGLGFGRSTRIGLRRPGTRTVLVRPLASDLRRLRAHPRRRVKLAIGAADNSPAFPYRTVRVRVRGA